ncbi:MAG: SDR family oxidoreductase [Gemmatimonas sp.]|nr:SDR family oxidoreductase [Gemmatimonas sp.]
MHPPRSRFGSRHERRCGYESGRLDAVTREAGPAAPGEWPSRPVVALTGASSGIGLATANAFASRGSKLALGYYGDGEPLARLAENHPEGGDGVVSREFDVADRAAAAEFIQLAEQRFDRVDVLVTCAGVHIWNPTPDHSWDDWDRVLDVNLNGTFACIRSALPGMMERRAGRIITFSSELALTGHPEYAAYCASKGAIVSMTKALAREAAPAGVLVNCIAPGPIDTPMMQASPEYDHVEGQMPIGRYGRPEEIAEVVVSLASEAGSFYVGQVLSPNGGAVI